MDTELKVRLQEAVRIAKLLFDRNRVSGSAGNISFKYKGNIYISAGGTCFGWLTEEDFAVLAPSGNVISGKRPSKEYPMHKIIYDARPQTEAVIHTHSFYSVLASCLVKPGCRDVFTDITPYLRMKVGSVGMIPKAAPGSERLFELLKERVHNSDGYLLANHGPVVAGRTLQDAFYSLEELEETAKVHYYLNLFKGED